MYGLVNTIINKSNIPVYCAYSAAAEDGGEYDVWKVSILPGRALSKETDIDYIKPTSPNCYLCWGGTNGGVVRPHWQSNNWIKVRQFVTTEILSVPSEPMLGYLRMWTVLPGTPAKALDEARKYDGGSNEANRGTKKTQEALNEWDELIRIGQLSYMKTQGVPYTDLSDSPDEDFNPLGTYDVTVAGRWRYEYVIKSNGTVTWKDMSNRQTGSGTWDYNNNGIIKFKWNGSNTKEQWLTQKETGTCQYEGKPEYKVEWSKR
jgi:hypothetical protein